MTAPTSVDMRSVESWLSAARPRTVSVAATQATAASVAGPASACSRSSHSASTPAAASGSATRHGSGTPRPSSRSRSASSASAASRTAIAPRSLAPARASRCRATSPSASARSTPASTKRPIEALTTSTASAICAADRRAAAAGLLSWWASPAAISPSEAMRSRCCSTAVIRLMIGVTWLMTRPCTAGRGQRQSPEVLGGDHRHPADDVGLHAHLHVVAGQHGDREDPRGRQLAANRLAPPGVDDHGLDRALEQEKHRGGCSPASARNAPGS